MNNIGDITNTVNIYKKAIICSKKFDTLSKERQKAKFLGHVTVKTEAFLSAYDCSDEAIYTFEKGRWFVYLLQDCKFHIEKVDEDIHA